MKHSNQFNLAIEHELPNRGHDGYIPFLDAWAIARELGGNPTNAWRDKFGDCWIELTFDDGTKTVLKVD